MGKEAKVWNSRKQPDGADGNPIGNNQRNQQCIEELTIAFHLEEVEKRCRSQEKRQDDDPKKKQPSYLFCQIFAFVTQSKNSTVRETRMNRDWKIVSRDQRTQLEYGQIHRDDQPAENNSENNHDYGLHQRGQTRYGIIHFFFIKLGDFS
jgi:hypothetical protein